MLNANQYTKSLVVTKQMPVAKPGSTVKVFQRIKEGEKTRVQAFEGIVIARKHGSEAGATFTIRRVVGGIGVEKTYPLFSPTIEKVQVIKEAKVRRAKLYYLRKKSKKEARRKIKAVFKTIKAVKTDPDAEEVKTDLPSAVA